MTQAMLVVNGSGYEIKYGKYRMWHHVPFVNDTALVVDLRISSGGYGIIDLTKEDVDEVSAFMIENAIQEKACSIGSIHEINYKKHTFTSFRNREGYPPGYFTHKVGKGCSGK